jgi:hypothetical protein
VKFSQNFILKKSAIFFNNGVSHFLCKKSLAHIMEVSFTVWVKIKWRLSISSEKLIKFTVIKVTFGTQHIRKSEHQHFSARVLSKKAYVADGVRKCDGT